MSIFIVEIVWLNNGGPAQEFWALAIQFEEEDYLSNDGRELDEDEVECEDEAES